MKAFLLLLVVLYSVELFAHPTRRQRYDGGTIINRLSRRSYVPSQHENTGLEDYMSRLNIVDSDSNGSQDDKSQEDKKDVSDDDAIQVGRVDVKYRFADAFQLMRIVVLVAILPESLGYERSRTNVDKVKGAVKDAFSNIEDELLERFPNIKFDMNSEDDKYKDEEVGVFTFAPEHDIDDEQAFFDYIKDGTETKLGVKIDDLEERGDPDSYNDDKDSQE